MKKQTKKQKNHLIFVVSFVPFRILAAFSLYIFVSTAVKNFSVTRKYLRVDNTEF